jgi:hypothetical protein
MEKKICTKCNEEKEFCEFYKCSKNPNIYRSQCKKCMNSKSNNYYLNNKEKIKEQTKIYIHKNSEKIKKRRKIYVENNPNLFKEWYKKNKEHRNNYIKNYNLNPLNKLKNSLRSRINELMNKKYNNPKTIDLLGCDYQFFICYIESKFINGMSWDNYGYYGWHLDHIIPLSLAQTKEELYQLFHYTNLQPLWAKDNLKKNNKILN